MGKREKKKVKMMSAVLLAAVMGFNTAAMAEGLAESTAAQITTAIALAEQDLSGNSGTIKILLQQCLDQIESSDPAAETLQSVIVLLDTGNADSTSVSVLLGSVLNQQTEAVQQDTVVSEEETVAAETIASGEETVVPDIDDVAESIAETVVSESGLPIYEVTSFIKAILQDSVLVDVPKDWGNNASGRALTSYSPVNDSGAISPAAGTLTISYFPMEEEDETAAFDTYEKNIADMSVTTGLTSADATAADLPARKINFTMSVGANQFTCETICFAYDQTVYSIELMQGQQTRYDYFPMYQQVVDSAEVGDEQEISEAQAQALADETEQQVSETATQTETTVQTETETEVQTEPLAQTEIQTETEVQTETIVQTEAETTLQTETETAVQTETTVQTETAAQTETTVQMETEIQTETTVQTETPAQTETIPQTETSDQTGSSLPADMGTFMYELNGHAYQFPTAVSNLAEGDLPLNRQLTLPYDFCSDADMLGGTWTELVNTQYYYFENALYKEMAGVTNISGYPVMMSEGMLTALIDTQGSYVDVTLPGGIRVGSPESDIVKGFPEFAGLTMDGTAAFRGNELLYACNVRDDGCNGYVLIRNDAPYYSAVSIICENGIIKEISFECLGSVRANGVFS